MEEQASKAGACPPPQAADGIDAFGRWLRRERELRGLPREEVARLTKLAPGVIEALESGDAARMPPRAYLMGYLRSYAAVVGLDADDVLLRWQEIEGGTEPAGVSQRPTRRRRALLAAAVGLAAALVAGILVALSRCSA
jgi:cytoskeletal protein RodZ